MRELEELAFGAEVVVERLREDERVGDERAAGVVADEQHRPARRDVLQLAHVGAEPDVGHHAKRGERARDVLGVTQLERVDSGRLAHEMPRVGGMGNVERYRTEHPRVRGDGAEHPAHSAATVIARDHRKPRRCAVRSVVCGIEASLIASDLTAGDGARIGTEY